MWRAFKGVVKKGVCGPFGCHVTGVHMVYWVGTGDAEHPQGHRPVLPMKNCAVPVPAVSMEKHSGPGCLAQLFT